MILVGLGAWLAFRFRSFEQAAAELTARVDETIKAVEQCEAEAILYWEKDAPERPVGQLEPRGLIVSAKVHRVQQLVAQCADSDADFMDREVQGPLSAFRNAVTGEDFQEQGRKANPERVAAIIHASTGIMVALRGMRRKSLPRWPFSARVANSKSGQHRLRE